MKALTRKQLIALRAAIKGFATESKDIRRKYILPNQGEKRQAAWESKRALGHYARVHLLSYALMRGLNRTDLEKPSRSFKTNYSKTWELGELAKEILQICRYYGSYRVHWCKELTDKAILSWLLGGENVLFVRAEPADPKKLRLKSLVGKNQKMDKVG